MWERFHILSPAQVFGLSLGCAFLFATAIGLVSIPADGTPLQKPFLGISRALDPYVNFGGTFVAVVPVFLGYYHLGRLGTLLGAAIAGIALFATRFCAAMLFGFEVLGNSKLIEGAVYACSCLFFAVLCFWAHTQAAKSRRIHDAQRLLKLRIPTLTVETHQ